MRAIQPPVTEGPRWRIPAAVSVTIMLGLLGAIVVMAATGRPGSLGEALQREFGNTLFFYTSVQFVLFLPLAFALEHFFPARPEQRGITPSVVFDSLYFAIHLPVIIAVLSLLGGPLTRWLESNAAWLALDFAAGWPVLVKGFVALALGDFLNWFAHLVKHKVPLFWRFHMIHHSQTRMSLFTSNRTHPLDTAIGFVLLFLPSFVLFPSLLVEAPGVLVYFGFFVAWLERYQHCNIGTNLGPLRWILVTPQSHRVHHSTEPEHWNSNYATVFAWDRLFGTQHPDVTSYPTTGINDQFFPEPTTWSLRDFANGFVGQMLFPFDTAAVRRASTGSPHDPASAHDRALS